jgi:hypothetical protein
MELYIEKETPGVYGLIDTFINENVSLNTKTLYTQDITAVFKGFTNSFSVQASPNNVKLLGYFGFTDQLQPTNIQKRAKLYLDGNLFKEGIVTLENVSWINTTPSLFQLSFSDGQKNLTEILGEDTLAMLDGGDLSWTTKNIQNGLKSIQSTSDGLRWFIPLVSVNRIFTIYNSLVALPTDNINFSNSKPITSENVLLPSEIRPAMFMSEILESINKKYDIKIDPKPYIGSNTQLTDLCTMCVSANVAINEVKAKVTNSTFDFDKFREERFDIIPKPAINAFELNYLGYGPGAEHQATFDMIIQLAKKSASVSYQPLTQRPIINTEEAISSYINNIEVWEVFETGEKKKKLNYTITSGSEIKSSNLRIRIGLDVFTPEGGNAPSTLVKPLISVYVSADNLSEWKFTNYSFNWSSENWIKGVINNVQPTNTPTTVNLFKSLPEMKVIDFVKSIYTMFAYKKFKDEVLNDFYYQQKTVIDTQHKGIRVENDLTPYADLSKLTKKTNTKYDGYDLKHVTSEYQSNKAFLLANGMEYGQLKFPLTGKPKTEFKIETNFTAPCFNPIASDADTVVNTFYPFDSEPKLNDIETRFIYDTITKEFPIFYYHGVQTISTAYAFVDTDLKQLKPINLYHKISHKSNKIFTGASNYISSLFNIVTGDFIDQNTLYVQGYKEYIEDTLSGKKLIHTIDLTLPNIQIQKFEDSQEIIIKETKYTVLESTISLTDGKTKLILLNK